MILKETFTKKHIEEIIKNKKCDPIILERAIVAIGQVETHEETIVREIKEELNSIIAPIKYIGSSSFEYHDLVPYEDFSITLYAYKCKLISGDLTLSEHTAS